MTILDEIVANTRNEVAARKEAVSVAELESSVLFQREPLVLVDSLRDPSKSSIIAEVKKKSPSKGVINDSISVEDVAAGYEKAGASAVSVLTDFQYFGGKMEYLTAARAAINIPILRKDFMVDPYQVIEAKAIGADIILLIAASLSRQEVADLSSLAKELGLSVLLEVHNEEELERTVMDTVDVIGVNNRNLKTFEVSIENSLMLAEKIPSEFLKISESGLKDGATIQTLKAAGFEGFLIGETFMKTPDPAGALEGFIEEIEKAALA